LTLQAVLAFNLFERKGGIRHGLIETKAQPRMVCGIRIDVPNIREVNSVPACYPADQGIIDRKDKQRWMLVS
jgi:hypothetical protein